ncbi:MAG: thioether cross-link-forming SCIFF peptide maturase [Defluviitaleaceae bacterium]|nr:thioether cross-link-forming SCIFF peptide maturase [Defluviitaleaceae bacterium]
MIHIFTIGSRNLVLDVGSGSLHQVDDAALPVLKGLQDDPAAREALINAPVGELCKIEAEIRHLIDEKQLFAPDNAGAVDAHMQKRKPVVKALCLHMAHDCNLRCRYCFAGDGTYNVNDIDRGLMPLEVGKKALDFLIENSGARRNLEVDFFGGEPMLNFDTVKALVAYGRQREAETGKKFRFTLTTNGALLTDEANAYINENFDNVVLSLDGRPAVHDNMRLRHDGKGSYDTIYPKVKALADARGHKNYYVRGTYTRHNKDFAADVMHLADAGFEQISVEPVVAPEAADYSLRESDLPELFAEYEKLADALLAREREGKGVHFFHFVMDMDGGPCLAKRVTGCGAGSEYLAVTPSGQLYPCHQFVGDETFRLGDLDTGVVNQDMIAEFAKCHVFAKPECASCWARYYCSGGCMANAHHTHGDILKPDKISCELQKKRIECALYMIAERNG